MRNFRRLYIFPTPEVESSGPRPTRPHPIRVTRHTTIEMTKMTRSRSDASRRHIPSNPSHRAHRIQIGPQLRKPGALYRGRNSPHRSSVGSAPSASILSQRMKRVRIAKRRPGVIEDCNTIESLRIIFDETGMEHKTFYESWLKGYGMRVDDLLSGGTATGPVDPHQTTDVVIECKFRGCTVPKLLYLGIGTREPEGVAEDAEAIVSKSRLRAVKRWFSRCPEQYTKRVTDLDRLLWATSTPIPSGDNAHAIKRIACRMILNSAVDEHYDRFC